MLTSTLPDIFNVLAKLCEESYGVKIPAAALSKMLEKAGPIQPDLVKALDTGKLDLSGFLTNGKSRSQDFCKLCFYLNGGDGAVIHGVPSSPILRAKTLIAVNKAFSERNVALKIGTYQGACAMDAIALLGSEEFNRFKEFVAARSMKVADYLELMAGCGGNRQYALQAMCWTAHCFIPSPQVRKTRSDGFTTVTIAAIAQAARLYPMHQGFPGFRMWGTGDNLPEDEDQAKVIARDDDTVRELNLYWHFKKHVLSIGKPGATTMPSESAWWWRKLNISIQRSDLTLVTGSQEITIAPLFATSGALKPECIEDFLKLPVLAANPLLVERLVLTYKDVYGTLALTESRQMKKVAVLISNGKVMVSGVVNGHDGDLYIIARVEKNGIVGISSCYMADDIQQKLDGRKSVMLWEITDDFA